MTMNYVLHKKQKRLK